MLVKMKVIKDCYYDGRLRKVGAVVDYDMDDRGEDENGEHTEMPSWGERVGNEVEAKDPEPVKTEFKETTLHEQASSKKPTVTKANTGKKVTVKKKSTKGK
jgi:hypothetical protein|tara:strand:+ start:415 stop:717 length:303 start_codon:yes stop_codon:yes gene_type:complete